MASVALLSAGSLVLLMAGLALRMSLFRVSGAKGEGDPKSLFERVHKAQVLTAEYSVFVPIILYFEITSRISGEPLSFATNAVVVCAAVSRFIFAFGKIAPSFAASFGGATLSYLCFFAFALLLVWG
eukprot:Amastigsp_a693006_21.p1 type:complete len:127 gc:universal Amastigsp_a693006_21:394-14(-)